MRVSPAQLMKCISVRLSPSPFWHWVFGRDLLGEGFVQVKRLARLGDARMHRNQGGWANAWAVSDCPFIKAGAMGRGEYEVENF